MVKYSYQDIKTGLLAERFLYFKFISVVFAAPIAYCAYRLNISANQITITGILLSFVAAYFNMGGYYLAAIVVFHLFFLCDAADGVLARGTDTKSALGGYLDEMAHYIFHTLFFLSFALSVFYQGMETLALFTIIFLIMNILMRAHDELTTVILLREGLKNPSTHIGSETLGATVRGLILRSFDFPNVLVYMSIFIWKLRYLEFYFIYAAIMASLYYAYFIVKTIRTGFANSNPM